MILDYSRRRKSVAEHETSLISTLYGVEADDSPISLERRWANERLLHNHDEWEIQVIKHKNKVMQTAHSRGAEIR